MRLLRVHSHQDDDPRRERSRGSATRPRTRWHRRYSQRALLVWQPGSPVPTYAVPVEDILLPEDIVPSRSALPAPADDELTGMVVLRFSSFDAWLEDDDQILGHPRDPFHGVDVRATSQRIQLSAEGQALADTVRGRLLHETSLPTRYYVPRCRHPRTLASHLAPHDLPLQRRSVVRVIHARRRHLHRPTMELRTPAGRFRRARRVRFVLR